MEVARSNPSAAALDYQPRHAPLPVRIETFHTPPTQFDWSASAILGHRSAASREFADLVAIRLVGNELPWDQRQALLRHAPRLKINRFEANLIIAAVQNHLRPATTAAIRLPQKSARPSVASIVLLILAIEAGILAALWHFLF
jgi:hypothetical protein